MASYARGYGAVQVISDVGSGLNEERVPEALGMVPGEGFKIIVSMRLTGLKTLRLFSAFGAEVGVISHEGTQEELVKD